MVGPLAGADGDSGAPTINIKKRRWRAPWRVLTMIQEHPPSTASPLVGADGDPGAPTINVKKYLRWAPWQELSEIRG
jgi:hypothetical protein